MSPTAGPGAVSRPVHGGSHGLTCAVEESGPRHSVTEEDLDSMLKGRIAVLGTAALLAIGTGSAVLAQDASPSATPAPTPAANCTDTAPSNPAPAGIPTGLSGSL